MGLKVQHPTGVWQTIPPMLSADWPVRLFYGLVTFYQGLFGLFVPSSVFALAVRDTEGALVIIGLLIASGLLLIIDGLIAMVHYCTSVNCQPVQPAMRVLHRWRHLLFLPPAFCYYATFVVIGAPARRGLWVVLAYYVSLALMGVALCLRDGLISQRARAKPALKHKQKHA